ncbi:hypothetical protein FO519_001464 [Halicephalobus sp. NKZ332]|nr:hypothetical protein FO519_001464 [Halicephalobus sp. NKZ332]
MVKPEKAGTLGKIVAILMSLFFTTVYSFLAILRLGYVWIRKGNSVFELKPHLKPKCLEGWNHGYLELTEIKMHYVETGDASKPLMICVHGFPEFWYSYRYQLEYFKKDYHVVAIDMRGYGDSSRPVSMASYGVVALAKDVAEAIEKLSKKKAVVIGHDWGAIICWNLAIMRPELIERLIILNVPHPIAFRKQFKGAKQLFKSWYIFLFQAPYLPEILLSLEDYKPLISMFRGKKAGIRNRQNFTDEDEEAWKYTFSKVDAFTGPINYYRATFREINYPKHADWTVKPKTLIVWGEEDVALALEGAIDSVNYCRDAVLKRIPGASHWVQQDAPELVNKYIEEFLNESDVKNPPVNNQPKSEPVKQQTPKHGELKKDYGPAPEAPIAGEKFPRPVETFTGTQDVTGGNKEQYYNAPPGAQPDLFSETKVAAEEPYGPAPTSAPVVDTGKTDFFPESTPETVGPTEVSPAEETMEEQLPEEVLPSTLSPAPEENLEAGSRPCCPCCREAQPIISTGGGCGGPAPNCGPPPIVGTPPVCCPQAPLPCCPRLPTCCIPQLPCCPRIQIPCCPLIQICCQPLNFGCRSGCRSLAMTRVRTKRLGCVPCIGRKKREVFEEVFHVRQKRLGCIPCLARNKRQAIQQPANCQRCNIFQQQIVHRVKRSFSCSRCATHHERKKRQAQIADFYRGNQLGAYRNCEQCLQSPAPQNYAPQTYSQSPVPLPRAPYARAMRKRSSGFTEPQHEFLSRVKRVSDGYDPLFKCDSVCCDYGKCIKSKPLRDGTYKIPKDEDFISGTASEDYDLSNTKPLDLKLPDIDSLVRNEDSNRN